MPDVTEFLLKIDAGDAAAADALLPLVYEELRKLAASRMACERADHTLQGTALVHEAYVRLVDSSDDRTWDCRGHFFSAAAEAMRRILVESARAKKSRKRGGDRRRIQLQDFADPNAESPDIILDLDEGLSRLASKDAESAELVKLRLFAGLSVTDAGRTLGMSRATAYENWDFARCWLATRVDAEERY